MSDEIVLMSSEERKDLSAAASFLRDLADQLDDGQLVLRHGTEELNLSLPDQVVLEVKVEEEQERAGKKMSVEVELEWTEGETSGVTLG